MPSRPPNSATDRVVLSSWPTPLEAAPRLAGWLGLDAGVCWIKRDDLVGLGGGGNKVRKLEYLCAAALERRATVLVTSGRRQSNHARITAAAAARLGLGCVLVLGGERPHEASGNLALEALMGTEVEWVGDLSDGELDEAVTSVASRLEASGQRVEVIPLGGSSPTGARGYVDCGAEIEAERPGVRHVVVAVGSGGTMAGLVAHLGSERVLGVDVGATADPAVRVAAMASALGAGVGPVDLRIRRDQVGPGYGKLTEPARAALLAAARLEGVFLDPVYTAKALSGLAAEVREGGIGKDEQTVFVHTGGLPGLFGHPLIGELDPPSTGGPVGKGGR
ncbi:MAG: pyridoxal-phosphate dependent enzyme [Acidimicrobiales bacterium]